MTAVSVVAPPGEGIDYETWRKIPIGTLLRLASDPTSAVLAHAAGLVPDPDSLKRRPYSDDRLCAVVDVYRYAVSQGAPPRAVIRETFGPLATKTVDRWLRRARDKGLLGEWSDERTAEIAPPKGPRS